MIPNKKRGLIDKYNRNDEAAQEEELRKVYEKELANSNLSLKTILKGNRGLEPLSPDSHQKAVLEKISKQTNQEKIKNSIKELEREHKLHSAPSGDLKFKQGKLETIGRLPKRIPQLSLDKPKNSELPVDGKKTSARLLSPTLLPKSTVMTTHHSPREPPEMNPKANSTNECLKSLLYTAESPRGNLQVTNSNINVYFYKNFNKFIQNLYVKGEHHQNAKQLGKKDKNKEDKYAPYKSDYVPKKNLLFVRKGTAVHDHSDKIKKMGELRPLTGSLPKKLAHPSELKQELNRMGPNRYSQPLNLKGMVSKNKQEPENNETEGKRLTKSRSLKQIDTQEGTKPLGNEGPNKGQFLSPRIGKY